MSDASNVTYLAKALPRAGERYYLDTSAIIALVSQKLTGQKIPPRTLDNAQRLTKFLASAKSAGASVRTTVLAFQEIAAHVRNQERRVILRKVAHNTWTDYKKADAAGAERDDKGPHASMLKMLEWAINAVRTHDIGLMRRSVTLEETREAEEDLRKAHRQLLQKHPSLDAMDALHIAVGWESEISNFVTFDIGWEVVSQIKVLR